MQAKAIWIRLRRGGPRATWFWRDDRPAQVEHRPTVVGDQPTAPEDQPTVVGDQPTTSVDEPPVREAGQAVPSLRAMALPGVGAGLVAGLFPLAILVVGEGIDASVRTSDAFALAFGLAIETAILAAGLVAGVLAAVTMPRRWWPAALGSALLAMVVAGLVAWVVLTANRFGLLEHSSGASGLLGARASRIILVRPAAEAALPCALAVAIVASLRLLLPRPAPSPARRPTPGRSALTGLAAAVLASVLLVPTLVRVGQLTEPVLATDALELTVPVGWEGSLDAGSGGVVLETTAMDVRILIVPSAVAAASLGTGAIVVGGVEAPVVLVQDRGPERIVVFDARTPSGVQRITVVGSPEALTRRTTELESLFAAIRWLLPD